MRAARLNTALTGGRLSQGATPQTRDFSVIAVPRVALTTLDTAMSRLALMTEATAERAIEPWAPLPTGVLETVDLRPFLGWDSSIFLWRGLVLAAHLVPSGLQELLLSFTTSFVLLGFRRGGRSWRSVRNSALERASFHNCLWLVNTSIRAAENVLYVLRWSELRR